MNESYLEQLIGAISDIADLVERIAPRRPVLEAKLLRLIRTTQYTWRWHPGTGRVTADLTAGYRVTLTPSEDATVVSLARKQPNNVGGLTDATFPDMYLSLDVWYWAYNKATQDDSVTLDNILSGRAEPDADLVLASSRPLAARAIDEELDEEWAKVRAQRDRNASEASNSGDDR